MTINAINVAESAANPTNISVETVAANRTLAGIGQSLIISAQLRNTGKTRTPATMVQWKDGDKEFGTTPVEPIEPGQTTLVSVEHPFPEAGVHAISCEAQLADDLPPDSTGQLIVEIKDELPILIVDGTPQVKGPESGTNCLLAALGRGRSGPKGTWHSVLQPTVIEPVALDQETLLKYGAVVLIDFVPPKAETIRKLTEYARNGGGVWFVLGSNVEPAKFNELLFDHAQGIAPLALGTPVGDAASHEKAETLHPADAQHAATRLIADAQKLDLDRVRIYRRHQFDTGNMNRNVGTLLSTSQGAPIAIERGLGRGRVIVQAVPFGTDWSNLPLNQSFVVWANESLWYLAEPSVTNWNLNPGESLEAAMPSENWRDAAKAISPLGRSFAITGHPRGTQSEYRFSRTSWPGDWKLELLNKENKTVTLPFHVRRDIKESDLTQITAEETKPISEGSGLQFTKEPLAETTGAKATPRPEPVWPMLLAGLLALLILEPLLAGLITRNRMYGTPQVRAPLDTPQSTVS